MKINEALAEYYDYCTNVRNFTQATISDKQYMLSLFVRWYGNNKISKLSHDDINNYIAYIRSRGASEATVVTYVAQIIAFIKYLHGMGYKTSVKLPLVAKQRVFSSAARLFYSAHEINQVIGHADDQTALMIAIAFDTGMRRTALSNLRIDNFCGRRVVYIDKCRKRRESYITEKTKQMLDAFVQNHRITNKLWGSGGDYGVGISSASLHNILYATFNDYADKLELQNGDPDFINRLRRFHIHTLRHSFATDLQLKGASVEEIKELMGHSNTATTEHYLHGFDGQLQKIFDKYKSEPTIYR